MCENLKELFKELWPSIKKNKEDKKVSRRNVTKPGQQCACLHFFQKLQYT